VLRTPSEPVQRAVANCFPGLMGNLTPEDKDTLVAQLLDRTLHDDKYAGRRGGSFGLAGAVKGIGFSALKANGIMDALKEAVEDEKRPAAREGGLLAFECLCERLGRLFEPVRVLCSHLARSLAEFESRTEICSCAQRSRRSTSCSR